MSESEVQKQCIKYAESLGLFIFAIPSVSFGSSKKTRIPVGYKKGMPDLCIPRYKLYMETKDNKPGKVKEHEERQAKVHQQLRNEGCHVYRFEGFEEFKKIVDDFYKFFETEINLQ